MKLILTLLHYSYGIGTYILAGHMFVLASFMKCTNMH